MFRLFQNDTLFVRAQTYSLWFVNWIKKASLISMVQAISRSWNLYQSEKLWCLLITVSNNGSGELFGYFIFMIKESKVSS